jgi:hypothetical protein
MSTVVHANKQYDFDNDGHFDVAEIPQNKLGRRNGLLSAQEADCSTQESLTSVNLQSYEYLLKLDHLGKLPTLIHTNQPVRWMTWVGRDKHYVSCKSSEAESLKIAPDKALPSLQSWNFQALGVSLQRLKRQPWFASSWSRDRLALPAKLSHWSDFDGWENPAAKQIILVPRFSGGKSYRKAWNIFCNSNSFSVGTF